MLTPTKVQRWIASEAPALTISAIGPSLAMGLLLTYFGIIGFGGLNGHLSFRTIGFGVVITALAAIAGAYVARASWIVSRSY